MLYSYPYLSRFIPIYPDAKIGTNKKRLKPACRATLFIPIGINPLVEHLPAIPIYPDLIAGTNKPACRAAEDLSRPHLSRLWYRETWNPLVERLSLIPIYPFYIKEERAGINDPASFLLQVIKAAKFKKQTE